MISEELRKEIKGEVVTDPVLLAEYSHDASLIELEPALVVFPKDVDDVKRLVQFVSERKRVDASLSLTARSGGTDMTGGSVGDSIIVAFGRYFNHIKSVTAESATVEPGVFYRDFEKETLKYGALMPSYPASREICAIGGMVNNNAGGEKTLRYGKTADYVQELKVVLRDGNEYVLRALGEDELKQKINSATFEGEIYRNMYALVDANYEILKAAKPAVSKNSAGYALWDVWDRDKKVFDLTRLWVGSQGTLGFLTEATLRLVPAKKYSGLLVVFLKDLKYLTEISKVVLESKPETFEAYDDHTLKLALKFFPSFAKMLGTKNLLSLGLNFLPELLLVLISGMPKMVLQIEFAGDDEAEIKKNLQALREKLRPFHAKMRLAPRAQDAKKYWLIRRESFNLLRQRIKDKHTAPFIDDVIVRPEKLPEFLPKLNAILAQYPDLVYTLAGHLGDGNFHIIPLMNLDDEKQRAMIPELARKIYDLVLEFGGSITAEHNDGLIRTPFLKQMFGEKVYALFEETKRIFDPDGIFNPRKKVGGDLEFMMQHIRRHW